MELPPFILGLPQADVPFDESMVKSHALSSKDGLLVFFEFMADFEVPAHSHGAQWGTVLEGELGLTVDTLGRWERRRKGPACVRAGRKIFYRMSVVQDWLQSQEMPRVTETKPGKARGRK